VQLVVLDERRFVEVLQQEAGGAVADIGQMVVGPGNLEAEVGVELLRDREVGRGDEGLDLDGT
jgi:hypothetical protein